jgi:hypothetical protein
MEESYSDSDTAGKAAAAQNGMTDGVNGVTVTITPAATGTRMTAVVTQSAPTYFMKVFHLNSMNVSARAVAALGPGSGCIFTLNQSGVDVGLSGQGSLSMPDCGVVIDSSSAKGLTLTGGATISAKYIGIAGNYSDSSNSPNSLVPVPVTGIAPVPNPLGTLTPPTFSYSSCVADPHPNPSGSQTVTVGPSVPGGTVCYNGLTVSGSGIVNFTPGTYIINGGFSSSGSSTIQETVTSIPTTTQPTIGPCPCGETFYLAPPNGALSITGSGAVNLSAPTTGAYNGILFYQDPNDTNSMKFAGSSGSTIAGIFYAPSASLSLSGADGTVFYANMVVNTLSISGNNNVQNYSKVNANTPLTSPRLVE